MIAMKPQSFFDLPGLLQESLLWDMELDYDSYESSKVQKIDEIMNGNLCSENERIIINSYKFMSEDFLKERAKSLLDHNQARVNLLKNFVDLS